VFDDAGTQRLGVINCSLSASIYRLGGNQIDNSTAEGGAGGADSSGVIYTGTAVTAKAYVILARLEWSAGLATLGAWATTPTRIEMCRPDYRPGKVLQTVWLNNGTGSTTSSTSMVDVTGATISVTPVNANSRFEINYSTNQSLTPVAATNVTAGALFLRDAVNMSASRLQGAPFASGGNGLQADRNFSILVQPGTTSTMVFKMQHNVSNASAAVTTSDVMIRAREILL